MESKVTQKAEVHPFRVACPAVALQSGLLRKMSSTLSTHKATCNIEMTAEARRAKFGGRQSRLPGAFHREQEDVFQAAIPVCDLLVAIHVRRV